MRNSFECYKSNTGKSQSISWLHFINTLQYFFFQNDIITVSYVILHVCSKTYEIPCFEKKEISRETAGLKQDFCFKKT